MEEESHPMFVVTLEHGSMRIASGGQLARNQHSGEGGEPQDQLRMAMVH